MTAPRIIRFGPFGPAETGLQVWEPIDPATLLSGAPVQRGHLYHEDATAGLMVGVWDCTPMTGKFEPYEVNEFMFLLEVSVTIVGENGDEVTVNAGEAFVIPKGLPCSWKQDGYIRKYFMIFDDASGRAPDDAPALNPTRIGIITRFRITGAAAVALNRWIEFSMPPSNATPAMNRK